MLQDSSYGEDRGSLIASASGRGLVDIPFSLYLARFLYILKLFEFARTYCAAYLGLKLLVFSLYLVRFLFISRVPQYSESSSEMRPSPGKQVN